MLRLCLTLGVCCLILGCADHRFEGSWYGQMPLDGGQHCRVRLNKNSNFDFTCRGTLLGGGQYEVAENRLSLRFQWMTKEGKSANTPSPVEMHVATEGNKMRLKLPNGEQATWERRLR